MPLTHSLNEALLQRMPLPLAQLTRRSANAKTARDQLDAAYCLWEAGLKLLASVALVEYADRSELHNAALVQTLRHLARPALGHWWEFARRLVPVLADAGDPGFVALRDVLLGPARNDMPCSAALKATWTEVQTGRPATKTPVRITELFDRLVSYRNQEIGHGAVGQRSQEYYERLADVLLTSMIELFSKLDVLAGRNLVYVSNVKRVDTGGWQVERYELTGQIARRIKSLHVATAAETPLPQRLYLERPAPSGVDASRSHFVTLHPLLIYREEPSHVFYLNARHGRRELEYICYSTAERQRQELSADNREVLAAALHMSVAEHVHQVPKHESPGDLLERYSSENVPIESAVQLPAPKSVSRRRLRPAIVGAIAMALVLVAGGSYLLVKHLSNSEQTRTTPAAIEKLDLTVWKQRGTDALSLTDAAALPLRPGDATRVEIELDRPAFLYVVYLDAAGKPWPAYPWRDSKWDRITTEKRRTSLKLPEEQPSATMEDGPSGIEAIVVLVRDEPISSSDVKALPALLSHTPPVGASLKGAVWLGGDESFTSPDDRATLSNADHPVTRLRHLLSTDLARLSDTCRAVCYPFQGTK